MKLLEYLKSKKKLVDEVAYLRPKYSRAMMDLTKRESHIKELQHNLGIIQAKASTYYTLWAMLQGEVWPLDYSHWRNGYVRYTDSSGEAHDHVPKEFINDVLDNRYGSKAKALMNQVRPRVEV